LLFYSELIKYQQPKISTFINVLKLKQNEYEKELCW